jgi:hypothetical protein
MIFLDGGGTAVSPRAISADVAAVVAGNLCEDRREALEPSCRLGA